MVVWLDTLADRWMGRQTDRDAEYVQIMHGERDGLDRERGAERLVEVVAHAAEQVALGALLQEGGLTLQGLQGLRAESFIHAGEVIGLLGGGRICGRPRHKPTCPHFSFISQFLT